MEPTGYVEVEDNDGSTYRWPIMSLEDIDSVLAAITSILGNPATVWL